MKNSKIAKILTALLSLSLIICGVFALQASAESTNENPVIVSKNIATEGLIHLCYAIPATEKVTVNNTTLSIYTSEDCTAESLLGSYTPYQNKVHTNMNVPGYPAGTPFIIFKTGGISANNMAKYYYAKAESNGKSSDVVRYSVAEYLNERLYVSTYNAKETEYKTFYKTMLNYGIAAEKLYGKPETNTDYLSELNYVYVDKATATLDGTNYSGLYGYGQKLAIQVNNQNSNTVYAITNIAEGKGTQNKFSKNTFTVKNTAIITPFSGETFETINHPYAATTADKFGNLTLTGQSQITAWSAYAKDITDHGFGIKADPENSSNKVLAFRRNSVDAAATSKTAELYIAPKTVAPDFNAIVFEADLKFDYVKTGTVSFVFAGGQNFYFGTNDTNMILQHDAPSDSGINDAYVDTGVAKGEWFNFRVEYYILDATSGITRTAIYINDNLFQLNNYTTSTTSPTDLTKLTISGWNGVFFDLYMDNMAFRKEKRDFVQPALDFEDGNIPSNIGASTWGGTNNVIDKEVKDGELVVTTYTNTRSQITFRPTEKYSSFGNETFNTWVFETDIKISGTASGSDSLFAFKDTAGKLYRMKMCIQTGESYMWFQPYSGGSSMGALSGGSSIKNATEYHLRVEYFLNANGKATISFIINGTNVKTITDTSIENVPAIDSMDSFYFDIGNAQAAEFTFDNTQFFPAYIER